MAAINKNFVVKNGIEVGDGLIYGNNQTGKVGLGTTNPSTDVDLYGTTSVDDLIISGTVSVGNTIGKSNQYLRATGTGVTWTDFPSLRTGFTTTAQGNQTVFSSSGFTYSPGLIDVYINGTRLRGNGLSDVSEFTAADGSTIVLQNACFGGETVDVFGYSGVSGGLVQQTTGITVLEEGSIVGLAQSVQTINFVGSSVTAIGSGIGVTVYVSGNGGSSSQWVTTAAGIHTLSNVGVGTTNPRFALEVGAVGASGTTLYVNGDARITGILTVGSSSITLDGSSNTINVGSGVTIDGGAGTISATSIVVSGTTLTGAGVTYITAGSGISVDQNTGNVTITATGGGGGSSQWISTAAGIHTLSNVGIGTTNPTSALTVVGNASLSGDLTFTGNNDIYLGDNGVINFGAGNDLQIFHNGSVSVIRDGGTGGLLIDSDNEIKLAKNGTGNDNLAIFTPDGSVELYYDNSKKFETTGAGVTVYGTTQSQQLNVSGVSTFAGAVSYASTVSFGTTAYFGADDEIVLNNKFKIYTDASNTYLKNFDTNTGGDLYIQSDVTLIQKYDGTETIAQFTEGAGVQLNYQGQARLSTVATGVIVGDNSAGTAHIPNELRIGTVAGNQSNASIMIANSSGVGIGTTNPTSALTVKGNTSLETLNVSGVSTFPINVAVGVDFSHQGSLGKFRISGDGFYGNGRIGFYDSSNNLKAAWDSPLSTGKIDIYNYINSGTENITISAGSSVVLQHGGTNTKLQTLGTGVTVTGTTFTNQLNVSGVSTFNNGTYFKSSTYYDQNPVRAYFGNSNELSIFSTGTFIGKSYNFIDANSGYLDIRNLRTTIRNPETTTQRDLAVFDANTFDAEFVKLYYGGNEKIATIGAGVTVTGTTFTNQLNVSGVSTSQGGFTSGIGVTNPVQITVTGNTLTFTVVGVGSTSLTLY